MSFSFMLTTIANIDPIEYCTHEEHSIKSIQIYEPLTHEK